MSASQRRKNIKFCACGRARPSFGFILKGDDGKTAKEAIWCKLCPARPVHAVDVVSKRCMCGNAKPSFGLPGEGQKDARWCQRCPMKPEEALDVVNKRCECGRARPYFGLPGSSRSCARWCKKCPGIDASAVDVVSKRCECGRTRPQYGLRMVVGKDGLEQPGKAQWCSQCPGKPEDAVDIRKSKCTCKRSPCTCGRSEADVDDFLRSQLLEAGFLQSGQRTPPLSSMWGGQVPSPSGGGTVSPRGSITEDSAQSMSTVTFGQLLSAHLLAEGLGGVGLPNTFSNSMQGYLPNRASSGASSGSGHDIPLEDIMGDVMELGGMGALVQVLDSQDVRGVPALGVEGNLARAILGATSMATSPRSGGSPMISPEMSPRAAISSGPRVPFPPLIGAGGSGDVSLGPPVNPRPAVSDSTTPGTTPGTPTSSDLPGGVDSEGSVRSGRVTPTSSGLINRDLAKLRLSRSSSNSVPAVDSSPLGKRDTNDFSSSALDSYNVLKEGAHPHSRRRTTEDPAFESGQHRLSEDRVERLGGSVPGGSSSVFSMLRRTSTGESLLVGGEAFAGLSPPNRNRSQSRGDAFGSIESVHQSAAMQIAALMGTNLGASPERGVLKEGGGVPTILQPLPPPPAPAPGPGGEGGVRWPFTPGSLDPSALASGLPMEGMEGAQVGPPSALTGDAMVDAILSQIDLHPQHPPGSPPPPP